MASRGKGRRRREALTLRSSRDLLKRGKSGVAKQLPPPPQAKDGEQLLPRSLKRIMALRQGSQGAGGGQAAAGAGKRRGNKFKMATEYGLSASPSGAAPPHAPEQPSSRCDASGAQPSGERLSPGRPGSAGAGPASSSAATHNTQAAAAGSSRGADRASASRPAAAGAVPGRKAAAAAGAGSQDHLSERQRARRERLKAKQQKKKARGKGGKPEAEDDDGALERRLLADRNKPKFGEQAMAPLQASLKRKHWDQGANSRHSALFERQMRHAAARLQPDDAVRDQVIEAYRQQKRAAGGPKGGVAPPTATRASLAALMSKQQAAKRGC